MTNQNANVPTNAKPLLWCEEPFRIFFPTGAVLGLIGVLLWPLYYFGSDIPYPNISHARLMSEGFMASFIFGFLGTAGPRITSARHFSRGEVLTLFTLDLSAAGLHLGGAHRIGDILFVMCLVFFVRTIGMRFHQRKDSPPPNFVLVGLGLLSGIAGAVLLALSEFAQYSRTYQFGSALLNECFVLLPVLGIAPFFIGRLLDLPGPDLPESRAFPPEWRRKAVFAALTGLTVIGSFALELVGWPRTGGWIRVAVIGFYVIARFPFHGSAFLATCLRAGMISILTGFCLIATLPLYRIGALHMVFIAGFNFIVFTVATRVIFGHSGNLELVRTRMPFFLAMTVFLFLAVISRITADIAPAARTVHLVGAAVCWLVGALIWMLKVIPRVRLAEPED